MKGTKEEKEWILRLNGRKNTSQEKSKEMESTQPESNNKIIGEKQGGGFKDVAGMSELKDLFQKGFINILKNQNCAKAYNLTPPGVLLYGPPGVGKTYIVKAVAQELGINFMMVSPDSVASKWMHGSTEKINQIFKEAAENSPTILFLDELDCMVPHRTNGDNHHQNEEVDEFLCKLGSAAENRVYVIAATNNLESIDRAVLRTGRFDELIYVGMPDKEAREELFRINLEKLPSEKDIDYERLANLTNGYNCSDLSYIVKAASRMAFNATIAELDKPYKLISQKLLEEVIAQRSPSVTAKDLREYERIRCSFSPKSAGIQVQKIGFN